MRKLEVHTCTDCGEEFRCFVRYSSFNPNGWRHSRCQVCRAEDDVYIAARRLVAARERLAQAKQRRSRWKEKKA